MSYKVQGKRLENHQGAQCRVQINDEGIIDFISYTTLVIRAVPQKLAPQYFLDDETDIIVKKGEQIDEEAYFLECTGTYSKTTSRQITWFLREYFADLSLSDIREISGKKICIVSHRRHS